MRVSFSSRSQDDLEQDVNPASVVDWFMLTLNYLLAKCSCNPDSDGKCLTTSALTAGTISVDSVAPNLDCEMAMRGRRTLADSHYNEAAKKRSKTACQTVDTDSDSEQVQPDSDAAVLIKPTNHESDDIILIMKDCSDFQSCQANNNLEKGDEMLRRYIVDMKWAYRRCQRIFPIGMSRYNKLKSGQRRIVAPGRGRLTVYFSCYRHAMYLAFTKYVEKCVKTDGTDKSDVLLLLDRNGKQFKPNYRSWPFESWRAYQDYLLFVDVLAFNIAQRNDSDSDSDTTITAVKTYSKCSFDQKIKHENDIHKFY